ncbi:hypothetical protein niasHT_030079 [Heterodera trifolii]|uniref:Uncharacterized protein n=1 Tax=Heterodera trifolii TaxID=157864 RepID=A0ABD2JG16_9BILA
MSDGLARPVSRSKSAGRFGRQQQKQPEPPDQTFEEDSDLNVRVKERDRMTAGEERPKSRLMSAIFKGVGGGAESSAEQKTSELKETLKRPLSSLFRRSQSQSDRNAPAPTHSQTVPSSTDATSPLSPQQPPRLAPTGRSPIANQQQKGTMFSSRTNQQQGAAIGRGSAIGNGNSQSTGAVSSTATRPFSGFPGRRPPMQTETTYGQSADGEQQQNLTAPGNNFNMALSEQAAIAPQINLRRLSGISYASDHNFAKRNGGGQRGEFGGEIDVNFLSRFLCPEDETTDESIAWNWDSLFASVSSELREEWALEEEANNGEMPTAGGMAAELGGAMPNGLDQLSRSRHSDQWPRN